MESPYNHDSLHVHCNIHVPINHLSQVLSAHSSINNLSLTQQLHCAQSSQRERGRERESRICGIVDRYTHIQCHVYYMHFILLFLLLLLQCMLLECTHCFVALNMHENQQHPPNLNKPYNYASMQSGLSIAISIRCLLAIV